MTDAAVVLHSGGQDSTTCLLLAIEDYGAQNVYPVLFSYEQKHKVEIEQAQHITEMLGVQQPKVLHVRALRQLGGGALTSDEIEVNADAANTGNVYAEERGLPSTVVPGRNVVFLALAAGYGASLGIYELWTGGCLADRSGYPDCRWEFYLSMAQTLRLALDEPEVRIITPLIDKTKGETFKIAADLGQLDLITGFTHTCYHGDRTHVAEWGAGCGECPACITRAEGWEEYKTLVAA